MPQPLSAKDASLSRQVIRLYDGKQYKRGIKVADQILRKNPNHGETLAMKALIINSQGRTEEAFAMAKDALKFDMKSHVCWHVYGLLYRAEKNFEEAIKAYKFALKLEPESPNILRDLALLQVHTRDYNGYIASRRTMLQSKSAQRQYWTALAVANHLAGNLKAAETVLTTYEDTLNTPPPKSDLIHCEAALYRNTIIAEMGDTERALDHLRSMSDFDLDRTAFMELEAQYLLQLRRNSEAEAAFRALIQRNTENRAYFYGLEQALGFASDRASAIAVYEEYARQFPRADAPRRIPLDFLTGAAFREAVDRYLQAMLHKAVPSTFANLKALYTDQAKCEVILALVEGYAAGQGLVQENGTAEKQSNGAPSKFEEAVHYFLAQHYNYFRSRDLAKAMSHIDHAIELSPKAVEYHMTKARIFKHRGEVSRAAEMMEHARTLDEKDRYINSKTAKYHLRNDDNDTALKTMSKFTRNETAGGPLGDLHEMQCMWYLTEDGEASARQGKYGLALKRFTTVADVFDVWQEDQFDFHTFSLRKGQIRAYIDMIRWEDRLREHPFYSRAAIDAIRIYLILHERALSGKQSNGGGAEETGEDAEERRKALKKAKREQQKLEKAEAAKAELKKNSATTVVDGEVKKVDLDPLGTKLAQTEDPLKDAMKFLAPLLEFSPRNIVAQQVGFDVFLGRKKYLLALKCLLSAAQIDAEDPVLHEQIVRFKKTFEAASPAPAEKSSTVIKSLFETLCPATTSLEEFNKAYLDRHSASPVHVLSALRVRQRMDASTQPQNEEELTALLSSGKDISLQLATEALDTLRRDWRASPASVAAFATAARALFPHAPAFAASE